MDKQECSTIKRGGTSEQSQCASSSFVWCAGASTYNGQVAMQFVAKIGTAIDLFRIRSASHYGWTDRSPLPRSQRNDAPK
jgi:hypothetical protein